MGLGFEFVQVQAEDLLSSIRLYEQNHHRTTVGRRLKMGRHGVRAYLYRGYLVLYLYPGTLTSVKDQGVKILIKSMTSGTSKSNCSGESSQSSQN